MQLVVTPQPMVSHPARFNAPVQPAASTAPKLEMRLRDQIRFEGKSRNTADV